MYKLENIIIPACMSIIDNAAWFNGLYKIIKFPFKSVTFIDHNKIGYIINIILKSRQQREQ